MEIKVQRLAAAEGIELPQPATRASAGADVRAAVVEPLELAPGEWQAVPTGLALEVPNGYEVQVRPRSGLARDFGVTVLNAPGTVDSDYRGEVHVLLVNHGREPFTVERGMRIAQLVVSPIAAATFMESNGLGKTERGEGGFGHSGLR